jgi:hypothetical protein
VLERSKSLIDYIAGDGSSCAACLKALDKEFDHSSEPEKEDSIEKVEPGALSVLTSRASSAREHTPLRRLMRFEDGDSENPNNWAWV